MTATLVDCSGCCDLLADPVSGVRDAEDPSRLFCSVECMRETVERAGASA